MKETKQLIEHCSGKYKRAYMAFTNYVKQNTKLGVEIEKIDSIDFHVIRGILYSFFDSNSILVSVTPNGLSKDKHTWSYLIYVDNTEIIESEFNEREMAEYIAFMKSFQFLDTKLIIEFNKNRFFDESSDSSCLNFNYKKFDEVINYKRKNLLT